MSSCFCSSHVFIMCLTCNSPTSVSALLPCSTSVFKRTLQPVNLTLHFTFSENCLNLKSGYLHKTAIKSLLQSCLCLFSTCGCSPGIHKYICGCVSQDGKIWGIFRTCPCVCGILHFPVVCTGCCMVKNQRWAVSLFLFAELCPCGCAALPFHLEGSYSSLSHVHSVMHTARETLKNHRCLPQNLPHLTSWQCGQCCQCPQQTVLSYPARGQSQILLFCSGLTLLEFFLSPTFSELLTRKAINSPGWWSWLCYHHCAWYKDRLNQLLMGLSGTDEGTQKVT